MSANEYFGQLWGGGAGEGLVGSGMKGGKGERLRVGGIHRRMEDFFSSNVSVQTEADFAADSLQRIVMPYFFRDLSCTPIRVQWNICLIRMLKYNLRAAFFPLGKWHSSTCGCGLREGIFPSNRNAMNQIGQLSM